MKINRPKIGSFALATWDKVAFLPLKGLQSFIENPGGETLKKFTKLFVGYFREILLDNKRLRRYSAFETNNRTTKSDSYCMRNARIAGWQKKFALFQWSRDIMACTVFGRIIRNSEPGGMDHPDSQMGQLQIVGLSNIL